MRLDDDPVRPISLEPAAVAQMFKMGPVLDAETDRQEDDELASAAAQRIIAIEQEKKALYHQLTRNAET